MRFTVYERQKDGRSGFSYFVGSRLTNVCVRFILPWSGTYTHRRGHRGQTRRPALTRPSVCLPYEIYDLRVHCARPYDSPLRRHTAENYVHRRRPPDPGATIHMTMLCTRVSQADEISRIPSAPADCASEDEVPLAGCLGRDSGNKDA